MNKSKKLTEEAKQILKRTLEFKIISNLAICINKITGKNSCSIFGHSNGFRLVVNIPRAIFMIRRLDNCFLVTRNKNGIIKNYKLETINKVIEFISKN